jgi:hypothetical protein
MPTDYYDDSSDSESSPATKRTAKTADAAATALLPLDFFPEKPEPGKVCSMKVEKVYGDQASVSYVKQDVESEDEDEEEMESEEPSDMDAMMA